MRTEDGQNPGMWGRGPSERASRAMIRRRGQSRVGALVLALTLLTAPCAWAAGGANDAGSLWTSVETWFQSLFADWLGVDSGNPPPETTYDRADDPKEPVPPSWPTRVGPGSGGASTTDAGTDPDPNGG